MMMRPAACDPQPVTRAACVRGCPPQGLLVAARQEGQEVLLQHSVWQVQELGCMDGFSPVFLHGHPAMLQQVRVVLLYGHRHLAPKTGRQVHAGLRIHGNLLLGGVYSQATQVESSYVGCMSQAKKGSEPCCAAATAAEPSPRGPIRPQARPRHVEDRRFVEEGQLQATHLRRLRRFGPTTPMGQRSNLDRQGDDQDEDVQ